MMLCNGIWIYTRKYTQNKNGQLTVFFFAVKLNTRKDLL
jgi:hypothetical protein